MVVDHWRDHDFGWRVVIDRAAEAEVGFVTLNYLGDGTAGLDPDEFEIGWWLVPGAWKRGLASEAASRVRDEAFERVRAASLVARLQPANRASAAVAERLGMSYELETTGRFAEVVAVYRLRAEDWRGGQFRSPAL
jgi:RimJ/RimL family protein N-acetyltransferase